ncbi:hypothetical protein B0H13DRAFT_1922228 [Mycena leptocephala]|nr:hypothetical protein B0H13DRAFT_1922228 [Mycena leptocephala]
MPPGTRRSARQPDEAAPPAPPDARAGLRTRHQATQAARPTGPPASTTARNVSSADQPRGFAGLSCNIFQPSSSFCSVLKQPKHQAMPDPAHRGQVQLLPLIPELALKLKLGPLTHQTAMASPGPRMHNPGPQTSDTENSSDLDSPPVIRPGRRGATRIPAPSFDSDDDLPPSQPAPTTTSQQPAGGVAAPRQRRRAAAASVGTTDPVGYVWTTAEHLLHTDKSEDFYASGSSLTTRRNHLQSEGHVNVYIDIVTKHGLTNKLPAERQRLLAEQRAAERQRLPFTMTAFTEQLLKVFVTNDLVR